MNNVLKLLEGKTVLAVGYGKSGKATSELTKELGGETIVYDANPNLEVDRNYVKEVYSEVDEIPFDKIELTVVSPGVPVESEVVQKSFKSGVETIGEIEFGYRYSKGEILAITGTNGKTTTTTLLGEISKKAGKDTKVVGNIGNTFTKPENVLETKEDTKIIMEISSFQLETIKEFRPKISAIINLTEDHLNRHKTMERYVHCKFKITENQGYGDYLILNADDIETVEYVKNTILPDGLEIVWVISTARSEKDARERIDKINAQRLKFYDQNKGFGNREEKDEWLKENISYFENHKFVYTDHDNIYINIDGEKNNLLDRKNVRLLGLHNLEDIMFATTMAYIDGIDVASINEAVSEFYGVEHRIEFVRELNGIKYYNDSKATNPDAAIKAIVAMDRPTILMLGGVDKKVSFKELAKMLTPNIKHIIVYGECREVIASDLKYYNKTYVKVDTFDQAFEKAISFREPGYNLLFSPGCASFDEFKGYEQRGNYFKDLVNKLEN